MTHQSDPRNLRVKGATSDAVPNSEARVAHSPDSVENWRQRFHMRWQRISRCQNGPNHVLRQVLCVRGTSHRRQLSKRCRVLSFICSSTNGTFVTFESFLSSQKWAVAVIFWTQRHILEDMPGVCMNDSERDAPKLKIMMEMLTEARAST